MHGTFFRIDSMLKHKIGTSKKKNTYRDFAGGPVVKNPSAKAEDMGLISEPGRSHMPTGN